MYKILTSIDQFGVPFQPIIQNDSKFFKSFIGGIFTFLIYTTTLIYFTYTVYRWQNGQTLPNISTQSIIQDGHHEFHFQYSPIQVQLIGLQAVHFLKNKRIYSPRITQYLGTKQQDLYTLDKNVDCGMQNEESGIIQTVCLDISKKSDIQFGSEKGDTTLFFYLYRCDPEKESDCATDEEIQRAIQTEYGLWVRIIYWQDQLDYNSGTSKPVPSIIYQMFDPDSYIINSVQLIQANYVIDKGIIIEGSEKYQKIVEVQTNSQSMDIKYSSFRTYHKQTAYTAFAISLGRKMIEVNVQYAKLGTILAEIGAIFQILMISKVIIIFINELLMEKSIMNEIHLFSNKKQCERKEILVDLLSIKIFGRTKKNQQIYDFMQFYFGLQNQLKEQIMYQQNIKIHFPNEIEKKNQNDKDQEHQKLKEQSIIQQDKNNISLKPKNQVIIPMDLGD